MDFTEFSGALFIYALTCAIFALIGRNRTIGYGVTFLLCLLLSPAVGALIASFSEKKTPKFTEVKNNDTTPKQEKTGESNTPAPQKTNDVTPIPKVPQERSDTTYRGIGILLFIMAALNMVVMILAICFVAEPSLILPFFISAVVFVTLGMLSCSKADQQKQEEKDEQKWENGDE